MAKGTVCLFVCFNSHTQDLHHHRDMNGLLLIDYHILKRRLHECIRQEAIKNEREREKKNRIRLPNDDDFIVVSIVRVNDGPTISQRQLYMISDRDDSNHKDML